MCVCVCVVCVWVCGVCVCGVCVWCVCVVCGVCVCGCVCVVCVCVCVVCVCVCGCVCGPGRSVGIATDLRAGQSGIESRWGRDFPLVQTGPGAHPASCKMGTGSFSGVECGWGVLLTTHPLLVPRSWKRRTIPLPTLWATPGL